MGSSIATAEERVHALAQYPPTPSTQLKCIGVYSMIVWNWNKVNSYISALKPLPELPNSSKWPQLWDILIFETSGTFRSSGKWQCFNKCTVDIGGNWVENAPRYLSKQGYTRQHFQNTPAHFKTPPGTPNTLTSLPGKALDTAKHSSDSLQGIWFVNLTQGMSGRTLGEMRVSDDVCWVSGMFVSV